MAVKCHHGLDQMAWKNIFSGKSPKKYFFGNPPWQIFLKYFLGNFPREVVFWPPMAPSGRPHGAPDALMAPCWRPHGALMAPSWFPYEGAYEGLIARLDGARPHGFMRAFMRARAGAVLAAFHEGAGAGVHGGVHEGMCAQLEK